MEIRRVTKSEAPEESKVAIILTEEERDMLVIAMRKRVEVDAALPQSACDILSSIAADMAMAKRPFILNVPALTSSRNLELMFEALEQVCNSDRIAAKELLDTPPKDNNKMVASVRAYAARVAISSSMVAGYREACMAESFHEQLSNGIPDEWSNN